MTCRALARAARWTLVAGALAVVAAPAAAGAQEIVVETDGLRPRMLHTATGQRVDFSNRTGRIIHVDFLGSSGSHTVVQVPTAGIVWAVFHRAGRHPFEVHFYTPGAPTLRGVVEVAEARDPPAGPARCDVTVMGVCLEP